LVPSLLDLNFNLAFNNDTTATTLLTLLVIPLLFFLSHTIRKDYAAFIALGPGGVPQSPKGYIGFCCLRPFALRNPFEPPRLPPTLHPQDGFLAPDALPTRKGPRPVVKGIAPQRQLTQQGNQSTYETLRRELLTLVQMHAHTHGLYTDTSCFEKHSVGVFVAEKFRSRVTCNGEVCHAHPSDGSMHLSLHPADVKLFLAKGWGQRHPIAREKSWWWRVLRTGRRKLPPNFVMVYAPRDEKELSVVVDIVRAAICWVSGRGL